MTDHRRNDSNLKYANKQILNSDAGFYNKDYRGSDAYYKKGNDFLNKGKRYREEQEGKIIFYVLGPNNPIDSVNMVRLFLLSYSLNLLKLKSVFLNKFFLKIYRIKFVSILNVIYSGRRRIYF
jgi:hypothetical protein